MRGEDRITQAFLTAVLDYDRDTGLFVWKMPLSNKCEVGDIAGTTTSQGYVMIGLLRRQYLAHRLAWVYVHGGWPSTWLDHINRNRADNRICNLREVTHAENRHNAGLFPANTSGVAGVHYATTQKRWVARIRVAGKDIWLGRFKLKEDAVRARLEAEIKYQPSKPR